MTMSPTNLLANRGDLMPLHKVAAGCGSADTLGLHALPTIDPDDIVGKSLTKRVPTRKATIPSTFQTNETSAFLRFTQSRGVSVRKWNRDD